MDWLQPGVEPPGRSSLLHTPAYLVTGGVAIMMGVEVTDEYKSKQKTAITPATRSSLSLADSIMVAGDLKSVNM